MRLNVNGHVLNRAANKIPNTIKLFKGVYSGKTCMAWNPDGEIENSGKSIFEIRIPNFCYIQVIVFPIFVIVAYLLSPNRCHW